MENMIDAALDVVEAQMCRFMIKAFEWVAIKTDRLSVYAGTTAFRLDREYRKLGVYHKAMIRCR